VKVSNVKPFATGVMILSGATRAGVHMASKHSDELGTHQKTGVADFTDFT